MARFRLLRTSASLLGRRWMKGDVLVCRADLTKIFPGAFERVEDDGLPSPGRPLPEKKKPVLGKILRPPASEQDAPSPPLAGEFAEPGILAPSRDLNAETTATEGDTAEQAPIPEGKDVTNLFPRALDEDYRVFRRGGGYFVYDADDLSIPLNTEGLKKGMVDDFIIKILKEV